MLKTDYDKCFKDFCENRNENFNNYSAFINSFMVKQRIDSENYVTTNYLLKIEMDATDLMIDLFNDEKFDFNVDKINNEINEFEIKRRKELNNPEYNLEEAQKEAVRTGMKYLQEDGLRQVVAGNTSIQEILRVCK